MEADELFAEGQIARTNGQTEQASVDLMAAHKSAMKNGDKKLAWEATHMLGVNFYQDEKYEDAKECLEEALAGFEDLGDEMLIGATLRDLGNVARKQENFDEAKEFMQESIDHLEKAGSRGHLGMSQVKMGMILYDQGDMEGAEKWIKKGLENVQNSPDRMFPVYALKDLGEFRIKNNQFGQAQKVLNNALFELNKQGMDINQPMWQEIEELLNKTKVPVS